MFQIQKLLALAGIARSLYGRWVIQQLLSQAVIVIGLSIASAIMVCVLLVGGFYVAYHSFLDYGLTMQQAMLAVAGIAALITAGFIYQTCCAVRRMRQIPQNIISKKSPMGVRAGEVIDSFLEGFLTDNGPRR